MGTNAQQFCLKWNNHQANMLTVFDRLLSSRSLVDVTIGCEGRQVKAHKVVLSACSPFFENLFTENPCKHPIVILKDIRYADLKALVEFMYKGEVNVVQEQLPTLLKTAEALKIKGLAEVTGEGGKSDDNKPNATVTQRPDSPGTSSRRKRQRVRRKSTDSVVAHSDSEESVPKASRTEHDDSSMDGATSLDDGSQASLQQQSNQQQSKEASINVQNNAVTVNNSSLSSVVAAGGNNATTANTTTTTSNGPNSSAKDTDFEPTRLLEASMTTDHGADNNSTDLNSTGPENTLIPDGLDIKPIITLEEGGATPTGAIVPASGASSLSTGTTDAISSLFPQGTGATALPGTSYQASPQSHDFPIHAGDHEDSDLIVPDVEPNENSGIYSSLPRKLSSMTASRAIVIPRIPQPITRISTPIINACQINAAVPRMSVMSPNIQMTPSPNIIKLPAGTDVDFISHTNARGKANQFWQYVCNDCPFITQDSRTYKKHRSFAHETKTQSTTKVCNICNKGFLDLENHLKVHEHGRNHVCDVCDLGFNSMTELRNHATKMHQGRQFLKCGYCDFTAVKEEISKHLLTCEPFKRQEQQQQQKQQLLRSSAPRLT